MVSLHVKDIDAATEKSKLYSRSVSGRAQTRHQLHDFEKIRLSIKYMICISYMKTSS